MTGNHYSAGQNYAERARSFKAQCYTRRAPFLQAVLKSSYMSVTPFPQSYENMELFVSRIFVLRLRNGRFRGANAGNHFGRAELFSNH